MFGDRLFPLAKLDFRIGANLVFLQIFLTTLSGLTRFRQHFFLGGRLVLVGLGSLRPQYPPKYDYIPLSIIERYRNIK